MKLSAALSLVATTLGALAVTAQECNGYPDLKDLQVPYFCWLSTDYTASDASPSLTSLFVDGVRHVGLQVCLDDEQQLVLCDNKNASFLDVMHEILVFVRDSSYQIVTADLTTGDGVTFASLEAVIDEACEYHADLTLGTKVYEQHACPFIYTQGPFDVEWPSFGELVNYDPFMAAWEGDGEIVGVQSQLILTHKLGPYGDDKPHYFSKRFSRTEEATGQSLHQMCKTPGPVTLQARDLDQVSKIEARLLSDKDGCDLNHASEQALVNMIQVGNEWKDWSGLTALQERINEHNLEVQEGSFRPMEASFQSETTPEHDEL
ncbi:hypothetical protein BC940DRAFT_297945 [Gongronella butleri]|nr:hypothetical protein BC940DRAFT_297945 [Gongronella butleri]